MAFDNLAHETGPKKDCVLGVVDHVKNSIRKRIY